MHVVVTGATGALGAGVVEVLLGRGATVHLPIVEAELPARAPWRTDTRVHVAPNVSLDDEAKVIAFYDSLPDVDASIHLVGGFAMGSVETTSLADFERQWRLNTVTCFLACREAVKAIRRTRGRRGGRIVNVAARPVLQPTGGMVAYVTAKAGVAALTQALAVEVLGDGILVNAVLPSIIDTPANRAAMPQADHARWPKPSELAETIAFLASGQNSLTTGTLVPVYGQA
jgi:NAD(P)-dependent dehydrogenase (short-subunit alcohol dehydrogenase family)